MRTWRRVVIAAFVAGTLFLFYRWWSATSARVERRSARTEDTEEADPASAAAAGGGAAGTQANDGKHGEGAAGSRRDRARADQMREQLRAMFAEAGALGWLPSASAEPAASTDAGARPLAALPTLDGSPGQLDPEYIKDRIHQDLFPLARECYADALKRDPKTGGTLKVFFRIVGDPKVGGVVDEVRMEDGTTITDPEFQTCVRESMMSVSFAPPENGHEVTVIYPIVFSPDDDEAGGD